VTVLERPASAEVVDDIVLPFAVESLSVRGRLVRLGPATDLLLQRHDYPDAVAKLVAEAVTLAALLGSTLKGNGRFQLQTKSDGPVTMLLGSTRRGSRAPSSRATTCSATAIWPSPSIRAAI
jgi:redox-regulated HSP33 family molecular chaperone